MRLPRSLCRLGSTDRACSFEHHSDIFLIIGLLFFRGEGHIDNLHILFRFDLFFIIVIIFIERSRLLHFDIILNQLFALFFITLPSDKET